MMWVASSQKTLCTWSSHGPTSPASPGLIVGGRYRLKQLTPLRLIHPPSEIRRSRTSIDSPGAHVICSTGLFRSSHELADMNFGLPFSSAPIGIGGIREFTLLAGQISRDGAKMYECMGMYAWKSPRHTPVGACFCSSALSTRSRSSSLT